MGTTPIIHKTAFIADGAKVIGTVKIGEESSVWYNCVLRGDIPNTEIIIGRRSNIQDGTVIHNDHGKSTIIGSSVTVGHNCVIHGCVIEDECLIGMGAIILSGAVIKKGAVVGAGAVVKENTVVEEKSLMVGIPAKHVKTLDESSHKQILANADEYVKLARESNRRER